MKNVTWLHFVMKKLPKAFQKITFQQCHVTEQYTEQWCDLLSVGMRAADVTSNVFCNSHHSL
jgi:hypothetical protein